MKRRLVLLAVVCLIAATPASADEGQSFRLGQGTRAADLVFGADGNIWFTATKYGYTEFSDVVGRATRAGEVAEYALPKRQRQQIGGIASAPDGHLWFADTGAKAIGRIGLNGQLVEFPLGSAEPRDVVVGPDGAIWSADRAGDRLHRLGPEGGSGSVPLPGGAEPRSLAVGADGNLWVTEPGRNMIARVTLAGIVTEFPLPRPESKPGAITRGADGNLWFGEEGAYRVGRIATSGQIEEFAVPGEIGGVGALAASPAGEVYFVTGAERAWTEIGSLSLDGKLTGLGCVTVACNLPVNALTVGPEGSLWYGTGVRYTGGGGGTQLLELQQPGTIGRFDPPRPATLSIPTRSLRLRGRFTWLRLECDGPAPAACTGRLRLRARIWLQGEGRRSTVLLGDRGFKLGTGARRRIAVRIREPGLAVLRRRRTLHALATATLRGGPTARQQLVLRAQHRKRNIGT